jgi:hypothetical protein
MTRNLSDSQLRPLLYINASSETSLVPMTDPYATSFVRFYTLGYVLPKTQASIDVPDMKVTRDSSDLDLQKICDWLKGIEGGANKDLLFWSIGTTTENIAGIESGSCLNNDLTMHTDGPLRLLHGDFVDLHVFKLSACFEHLKQRRNGLQQ